MKLSTSRAAKLRGDIRELREDYEIQQVVEDTLNLGPEYGFLATRHKALGHVGVLVHPIGSVGYRFTQKDAMQFGAKYKDRLVSVSRKGADDAAPMWAPDEVHARCIDTYHNPVKLGDAVLQARIRVGRGFQTAEVMGWMRDLRRGWLAVRLEVGDIPKEVYGFFKDLASRKNPAYIVPTMGTHLGIEPLWNGGELCNHGPTLVWQKWWQKL